MQKIQGSLAFGLFQIRNAMILICLLGSSGIYAANDETMQFSIYRPCDGNGDVCAPSILAAGTITSETPNLFKKFVGNLNSNIKLRRSLPMIPSVIFDSPGGAMFAGMELGEQIRANGYDTRIMNDQLCASACALAYLGGVSRTMENGAKYGVHQFSSADGNAGDDVTQLTVVIVAAYIEMMGVNRQLLDMASLVMPNEIYWLSAEQLKALRVDNSEPLIVDWTFEADEQGIPFVQATAYFAGDQPRADYLIKRQNNVIVLYVRVMVAEAHADRLSNFIGVQNGESATIYIDDQLIYKSLPLTWSRDKNQIFTSIAIPSYFKLSLSESDEIVFDFNVANAARDMDPTISLSARTLYKYFPAITR